MKNELRLIICNDCGKEHKSAETKETVRCIWCRKEPPNTIDVNKKYD